MIKSFTVAYGCLFVALILPILCAGLAKSKGFGKPRRVGGYDNYNPRQWLGQLSGWQARANAAQANSFEALPLFIAAVLLAHALAAPQNWVDLLSLLFVFFRLLYVVLYVGDLALWRSLAWTAAFACSVALFFLGFVR